MSQTAMRKQLKKRIVLAIFCLLVAFLPATLTAQLNHYESQLIKEKILNDFQVLIDTWTEELYFEMYQLGDARTKAIMSQVEFAQRMVDLRWKPALQPLQNIKISIIYRNFAAIQFDQQFENKVDQTQKIWKRMIFSSVLENKTWKFDLKQLINIPYEGQITDPEAERKAAEKARAEAEKKAQQQVAAPQQPGAVPQQPGAVPQQPGAAPQQPEAAPQQPEAAPQQPEAAPQQPGAAPQQPGAAPQQPGAAPQP